MQISLAFHILGIVFWVGGLLILTRILVIATADDFRPSPSFSNIIGRTFNGFVLAGLVITLGSGLHQLGINGLGFYIAQPWMHAKLTFLIPIFIITALVGNQVRELKQGRKLSRKLLGASHGITSLCLALIVFVTFLGR